MELARMSWQWVDNFVDMIMGLEFWDWSFGIGVLGLEFWEWDGLGIKLNQLQIFWHGWE